MGPDLTVLSVADRETRGHEARSAVPRSGQARWQAPADRPDPVALLVEQAKDRVPDLVPVRYGRMLLSPFSFYRGAALIMASDLATVPRSGISVQCAGTRTCPTSACSARRSER